MRASTRGRSRAFHTRSLRRQAWRMWLLAGILASTAVLVFAYNHEQDDVNSAPALTRWCVNQAQPCSDQVTWSLNGSETNVDTSSGVSVVTTLQTAFASWQGASLSGQSVTGLSITQGPASSATTINATDCVNVIGFADSNASSDFSTGTIAFTAIATAFGTPPTIYTCPSAGTETCPLPSCIVDADIEFNPNKQFSTAATTPSGDFDLQAIATHEAGHLLGMDHSGLASAIMFAFGDAGGVPNRNLSTDDVLGIGTIYPSSNFTSLVGTLNGTVTLSGSGVFAAHVVVTNATSGLAVADGLTNSNGTYSIVVPPGSYHLLALPLAGVYDLSDFAGWACGYEEHGPPCCDPTSSGCTANALTPPTNYTGKYN